MAIKEVALYEEATSEEILQKLLNMSMKTERRFKMKTYQKKTWSRKQKILLTIITLLVVQAFAGIPTPGVNPDYF